MSATRTLRRVSAVAAAVLVAAAAAGCSSEDQDKPKPTHSSPAPTARPNATYSPPKEMPSGKAGTPKGGLPKDVNEQNATAVAKAVAGVAFAYDTELDRTRADAQRRTTRWLTPAYAKTALGQPVAPPGASWDQMAAHHGYTTATARQAHDTAPASTPISAYRQFEVTVQYRGRDGWKGSNETWVTWIHLTRSTTSSPWKVDSMRVSA
ncbi:hypothetical protein BX261_7286 [Streptomyces sp. 2321.6]|uniref:hypothetical protein n=1 Tax=Streptomyces sp. 2321.6 TaxID=1938840 RepID=UPI000BC95B15|nr:hypothetical protein [Streptomyces sp. 2321.6]PBC72412.1 hypothetical protein BX261_7286 [Streptomyces sp. 2321.6]